MHVVEIECDSHENVCGIHRFVRGLHWLDADSRRAEGKGVGLTADPRVDQQPKTAGRSGVSTYGYHYIGILLIIVGVGLLVLSLTEILTQMALRRFIREFLRTAIIHHRR